MKREIASSAPAAPSPSTRPAHRRPPRLTASSQSPIPATSPQIRVDPTSADGERERESPHSGGASKNDGEGCNRTYAEDKRAGSRIAAIRPTQRETNNYPILTPKMPKVRRWRQNTTRDLQPAPSPRSQTPPETPPLRQARIPLSRIPAFPITHWPRSLSRFHATHA